MTVSKVWRCGNNATIQTSQARGAVWASQPSRRRQRAWFQTSRKPTSTMSKILRKRRPTASGVEIGPNTCTRLGYYHIHNLKVFCSEETAAHRCGKDVTRYRERVDRCFSASQIVLGGHRCAHKTLRSAFRLDRLAIPLIYPSQESKDVEEKLGDLIPWLAKLRDSVTTVSAEDNHEEADRREKLARFVSCHHRLAGSDRPSVLGHWKISRNDPRSYWKKGKAQGSSIKSKMPERSSSSSKNFGRQSSSTRSVVLHTNRGLKPTDVPEIVVATAVHR